MILSEIFNNVLVEAQNYEDMFGKFLSIIEQYGTDDMKKVYNHSVENDIKAAKLHIKKADRITWYLRYVKVEIIRSALKMSPIPDEVKDILRKDLEKTMKKGNIPQSPNISVGVLMRELGHFLSLTQVNKIQNYVFTNQSWQQVKKDFEEFEQEWQDSLETNAVKIQDGDVPILKFDGGKKAWWLLERGACSDEADQMGHCGNVPSERDGDRILSFRTATENPEYWVPHLTFIRDRNDMLGEMKGRSNNKPDKKYHPYIIELLKSKYVDGIKGGGYMPENNFSMHDLPESDREKLIALKPQLASLFELYRKEGFTDRVKSLVHDKVDSFNIPAIYDIDENTVTLQHFGDFENFLRELRYGHDLFDTMLSVFYDDVNDDISDDERNEIADSLKIDIETYERIIEKLTDKTLSKITNDLGIEMDFSNFSDRSDLAQIMDDTKYSDTIRRTIADMIILERLDLKNNTDFNRFQELIIRWANYSFSIGEVYISDTDKNDIGIYISTNDFMNILSEGDEDDSDGYFFIASFSGNGDYISSLVESYQLKDNLSDKEFLSDEDDEEIFNKFISLLETGPEQQIHTKDLKEIDFEDIANKIERNMVMVDSKDLAELKMLAGL